TSGSPLASLVERTIAATPTSKTINTLVMIRFIHFHTLRLFIFTFPAFIICIISNRFDRFIFFVFIWNVWYVFFVFFVLILFFFFIVLLCILCRLFLVLFFCISHIFICIALFFRCTMNLDFFTPDTFFMLTTGLIC